MIVRAAAHATLPCDSPLTAAPSPALTQVTFDAPLTSPRHIGRGIASGRRGLQRISQSGAWTGDFGDLFRHATSALRSRQPTRSAEPVPRMAATRGQDRAAYGLAGARPMSVTAERDRSAIARLSVTAPHPFRRYGDTAGAPVARAGNAWVGRWHRVRERAVTSMRWWSRGREIGPVLTGHLFRKLAHGHQPRVPLPPLWLPDRAPSRRRRSA